MARNIKRYGYGPNQTSTMAETILNAQVRRAMMRVAAKFRTPEQQAQAIEPMGHGARVFNYCKRSNRQPQRSQMTPRQAGRMRRKLRIGAAAYARGERVPNPA